MAIWGGALQLVGNEGWGRRWWGTKIPNWLGLDGLKQNISKLYVLVSWNAARMHQTWGYHLVIFGFQTSLPSPHSPSILDGKHLVKDRYPLLVRLENHWEHFTFPQNLLTFLDFTIVDLFVSNFFPTVFPVYPKSSFFLQRLDMPWLGFQHVSTSKESMGIIDLAQYGDMPVSLRLDIHRRWQLFVLRCTPIHLFGLVETLLLHPDIYVRIYIYKMI